MFFLSAFISSLVSAHGILQKHIFFFYIFMVCVIFFSHPQPCWCWWRVPRARSRAPFRHKKKSLRSLSKRSSSDRSPPSHRRGNKKQKATVCPPVCSRRSPRGWYRLLVRALEGEGGVVGGGGNSVLRFSDGLPSPSPAVSASEQTLTLPNCSWLT